MDEPASTAELMRRMDRQDAAIKDGFAQVNSRLDRLVSHDAFVAEQRRVDDKLKDLADDIEGERQLRARQETDERTARDEGDKRQQETIDKLTANLRWVAVSMLLPIALFLANMWMARAD